MRAVRPLRHRGRRSDGHIGPILPDLRDELEFGYAVGALHLSTFAVGALMASLTARTAVGALGLRRLLWLSVGGMASGCLLLVVGRSVVATLLATSLLGWFTASIVGPVQALLSAHHGEGRTVALVEADVAASLARSLFRSPSPPRIGSGRAGVSCWSPPPAPARC